MSAQDKLQSKNFDKLAEARALAHRAAQLLPMAAYANLSSADGSHSNMGWNTASQSFSSHPMPTGEHVLLSFAPFELQFVAGGDSKRLPLGDVSFDAALKWLDEALTAVGLKPASGGELPWELTPDVVAVTQLVEHDHLPVLAAWFDLADEALKHFKSSQSSLHPGPSEVRCWPHHFDIATYVSLETGDAETAKGIGVGLSPGDEGYNQPYFYVNPWPHLDRGSLPEAVAPGHWHTEGYVGLIATAEELQSVDDMEASLRDFIRLSFAAGKNGLDV